MATLTQSGLSKMIEECGELIQIASKKIQYFGTDKHPDRKGSMKKRLQEEIADVLATIDYVCDTLNLDRSFIANRKQRKISNYRRWADENKD